MVENDQRISTLPFISTLLEDGGDGVAGPAVWLRCCSQVFELITAQKQDLIKLLMIFSGLRQWTGFHTGYAGPQSCPLIQLTIDLHRLQRFDRAELN